MLSHMVSIRTGWRKSRTTDTLLKNLPVIGPSFTTQEAYEAVGDSDQYTARMLAEFFRRGFVRTYKYELVNGFIRKARLSSSKKFNHNT